MLASIQRVKRVFDIPKADRIEGVEVLGWKCVTKKGAFNEGDLCIYIEIDTIIPLSLLSDNPDDANKRHRLRTVKMKKQLSQGLVLGISTLNFGNKKVVADDINGNWFIFIDDGTSMALAEGTDVTEILGVEKYEKPIPYDQRGNVKGNFPGFLRKTDEVRVQSEYKLLEELKGKEYYITTKMDGTSATYYKLDGHFGVCSRNLELEDGDNDYWNLARKYNIQEWLPDGYCIQGEICGPKWQHNPLGLEQPDLFIFNFFSIKDGKYLDPDELFEEVGSNLDLDELSDKYKDEEWIDSVEDLQNRYLEQLPEFVPVEESGEEFNYTLDELLEKAQGNYSNGHRKEGIVVRSIDQTISFKVVNNEYLLKDEE